MCDANSALNHYPPNTWNCFTSDGYAATSHSNLAEGAVGPDAITLFINDFGSNNTSCGHRRWILYPMMKNMGHGCTDSYDCLWVIGDNYSSYPANMPAFICWPPQNYVPATLVFDRWSFSVPNADFTNTTITMTDASNNNISLNIVSNNANGYGDNTIVWEPNGIITTSSNDVTYNVKVNNVKTGGKLMNYSYSVIIIQPVGLKKAVDLENKYKIL